MKSKYETLLSVVDYVKNESENVVDELLMMGFTPCQLVNEFDFDENEVRNSLVYEEVSEELMENLDESEMPFLLDNYNAFDASLMFYFELNKDELREFKGSPLYKEMLGRYDDEKDEVLTEVKNEIFNDFEKRMDLEKNQVLQDKIKSAEKKSEELNQEKKNGQEINENEIKFKDLKPYAFRIHDYCSKIHDCVNMLDSLDEDLAVDRYQDTQPGGGNLVSRNREKFNEYEKKLLNLTAETLFGELYQQAGLEGKALLENFLSECENRYCDNFMPESDFIPELDTIYQVGNFLNFVEDTDLAEKEVTPDGIEMLLTIGRDLSWFARDSYDPEKEEFTLQITPEVKKEVLNRYLDSCEEKSMSLEEKIASAKELQKEAKAGKGDKEAFKEDAMQR